MKPINVTLYMKKDCTLCKDAYYLLIYLSDRYPLVITQMDITTDQDLERRYVLEIPVVEIEGEIVAVSLIDEKTLCQKFEQIVKV